MAAQIRKSWSPQTRARRSAEGSRRGELLVLSLWRDDAPCGPRD
jgi:hypothetical protein